MSICDTEETHHALVNGKLRHIQAMKIKLQKDK